MMGGVGAGGEKPPATRFMCSVMIHCGFYCSMVNHYHYLYLCKLTDLQQTALVGQE